MAVYKVSTPAGDRLVKARTAKSAINFVVGDDFKAEVLNTSQLAALVRQGMKVEAVFEDKEAA